MHTLDGVTADRIYATSGATDELLVFTRPTVNGSGDQTVDEGAPAEFSVVVDDFWQQVQWQISSDGGTTWDDVPDASSESLTVPGALADSGNLYRVVATSALFDPVIGEPMLLTVIPTPTPPPTPTPGVLPATGVDAAGAGWGIGAGALAAVGALLVVGAARRRRA
ncbi:hypothetical protein [Agromyces larvae]|uniref:Gram-positive cocci surface proteins LPxTG domain-containing protein n=1 Tax=Agromyces larvae TaxID=2929802 RepID=A0ABY4BVM7_9MICO|nr:hypothetical protein [Agromyces larvae]UOE43265.1 hypothetical protein MTO99_13870 [Agromyces larvae]